MRQSHIYSACLLITLLVVSACATSQPNNSHRKHGSGNYTANVYDNRGGL